MLGSSSTPRKMRKQIAFISVVIMSMLFYYLWEAMLISYFSTPFKFQPFNSLEEFLLKTDKKVSILSLVPTLCCHIIRLSEQILICPFILKLYVVKGTAYEYTFRNADDATRQKIWNERMEPYMNDPNYPTVRKFSFRE